MRRFNCTLCIFLFLILLSDCILFVGNRYINIDTKPIYYEDNDSIDVLFVGSSAWYTYWVPVEAYNKAGIASYSLGYGSIPADTIEYLLNDIEVRQDLKLIVIDARCFQYRDAKTLENGKIRTIHYRNVKDSMPFSLNKYKMEMECIPKLERDSYCFDLIYYKESWKECNIFSENDIGNVEYGKGYYYSDEVKELEGIEDYSQYTEEIPLSEDTTETLTDLCDYLADKEYEVVFVVIPLGESYDITQKGQYNFIKNIVEDYNYNFINCNDFYSEIGLNPMTDYYEGMHTNFNGAKKFTDWFADYIVKEYPDIPDRRNTDFSNWDECLEYWNNNFGDK